MIYSGGQNTLIIPKPQPLIQNWCPMLSLPRRLNVFWDSHRVELNLFNEMLMTQCPSQICFWTTASEETKYPSEFKRRLGSVKVPVWPAMQPLLGKLYQKPKIVYAKKIKKNKNLRTGQWHFSSGSIKLIKKALIKK